MAQGLWLARMNNALELLRDLDLGYPMGENIVHPPPDRTIISRLASAADLPIQSKLMSVYEICNGVSLPDIHVGYFVHPAETVIRGLERGEPTSLTGPHRRSIVVFGTDGGGGRFALGRSGGEVLYLGEGSVHDAVFDGIHGDARMLSPNLETFLERLLADTEAFVRAAPNWTYLV